MAELYDSRAQLNGVFKGTNFALSITSSEGDVSGALIQDFSVQYARQINRIYELGSANQYYIEGPTQGNCAISQIVGPTDIVSAIAEELQDICGARDRNVAISAGMRDCEDNPARTMTLGNAVMSNFQIAGSAANFIVSSNLAVMFTRLDLS